MMYYAQEVQLRKMSTGIDISCYSELEAMVNNINRFIGKVVTEDNRTDFAEVDLTGWLDSKDRKAFEHNLNKFHERLEGNENRELFIKEIYGASRDRSNYDIGVIANYRGDLKFTEGFLNPWIECSYSFMNSITEDYLKPYIDFFQENPNYYYKGMSLWSDRELCESELEAFVMSNIKDFPILTSTTESIKVASEYSETFASHKGLNNVCFVIKVCGEKTFNIPDDKEKEVIIYKPYVDSIVSVYYRK